MEKNEPEGTLESHLSIWIKASRDQNITPLKPKNKKPKKTINIFPPYYSNSKLPGKGERKITFRAERPAPIKILNVSYTKSTGLLADY